jgi:NADH:ubiquinone oxidoreductase subunit F (NADH-binding)
VTLTESALPPMPTAASIRLLPASGGPSLAAHLARLGPTPSVGPRLIEAVRAAGLRGRGGAAFPTGRKMAIVAAASDLKIVVANGTEGEPLSQKDRALLTANPHLVLDGIVAAAAAVGADRGILCVKRGQPALASRLRRAIDERADGFPIGVAESPDRYVTGQESALVHWLNDGEARPLFATRPSSRGVDGKATLVDNVETLAHVGLIARFGSDWFRQVGTSDEPGSALVTVSGGVARPGVYEVPFGLPLAHLLDQAEAGPTAALLLGGYFGSWVDPRRVGRSALCDAGLRPLGARFGCGVIVVVPEGSCVLAEVAAVAEWYAANSSGQCGACLYGLADIAGAVRGLMEARPGAEEAARRWTAMVRGRGACQLPDGAATFVETALDTLAPELAAHRLGGCGRPYGAHLPAPAPGGWR